MPFFSEDPQRRRQLQHSRWIGVFEGCYLLEARLGVRSQATEGAGKESIKKVHSCAPRLRLGHGTPQEWLGCWWAAVSGESCPIILGPRLLPFVKDTAVDKLNLFLIGTSRVWWENHFLVKAWQHLSPPPCKGSVPTHLHPCSDLGCKRLKYHFHLL